MYYRAPLFRLHTYHNQQIGHNFLKRHDYKGCFFELYVFLVKRGMNAYAYRKLEKIGFA